MGTRNLTIIVKDNKIKLAQYGQWDGYFSCTGKKFLEFVKANIQGRRKSLHKWCLQEFGKRVDILKPVTQAYIDMAKRNNEDMKTDTLMIPFENMFPQFSRNTGVKILDIINKLEPFYLTEPVYNKKTKDYDRKQFGFPVLLDNTIAWDAEFINVIDLDNDKIYMLTFHEFNGKKFEVPKVVSSVYDMPCWYSHDIATLPSIKAIQKYKEEIGLDYWQDDKGKWISN